FITVKGIKAQGNQLTAEKVKEINTLEPLPYEEPEEEEPQTLITEGDDSEPPVSLEDDGQITLSLD
ncbi:MAG: hypothetical protein ACOVRN_13555, partial [Flavobacterium sp.]